MPKTEFTPNLSEIFYREYFEENGELIENAMNAIPLTQKATTERMMKFLHICKSLTRKRASTNIQVNFQVECLLKEISDLEEQAREHNQKVENQITRFEKEMELMLSNMKEKEIGLPGIGKFKLYVVQRKTQERDAVKQFKFRED